MMPVMVVQWKNTWLIILKAWVQTLPLASREREDEKKQSMKVTSDGSTAVKLLTHYPKILVSNHTEKTVFEGCQQH